MIGVTGATGEVGSRVARRLAARGERQRLIVRDGSRAPSLSGADVATFAGYGDVDGMKRAFAGVTTLFLVSAREAPDRVEQHVRAVDTAVTSGVERIVYLSFIGAAADATFTFARHHFHTEEHIRASATAFTFSRQNLYMDLLPFLGGKEGIIRGPAGDGRVVPVARDDVADAITALLVEPGHDGRIYELTGPDALTLTEVADELTRTTGRKVVFENETIEQAYASRAEYGAPSWEVEGWVSTYTAIASGELDVQTDHVARLTGHQPIGVREFLSR
ncbi:MAG: SDR family oxidoreductase [Actinomycetota bacterium]|nr:SDR family oxidoreductase [Actinomycetota bacterium]